jgi:hypothetical protein
MTTKQSWKNDIAVLLIFFVRDDVFAKTFAAVREARPSKLLLYQDGPREGRPDDLVGIKKCREIASNIDWECEVYTNFQEKNWGCDPATFYSHKWAFSLVDKCIILEDDCVPSQSFFSFCKELLDRYENDERINRICGMNNLGVFENPYDYFFAKTGSCGWATWKRVAQQWDEHYTFLNDVYAMNLLAQNPADKYFKNYLSLCQSHCYESKRPHWETIVSFNMLLTSSMNIFPTKNLINNIGITENSAHSVSDIRLIPKSQRKIYCLPMHELTFPLKHPPYIIESYDYKDKFRKTVRLSVLGEIESILRRIRYGRFDLIWKDIKRRILK